LFTVGHGYAVGLSYYVRLTVGFVLQSFVG